MGALAIEREIAKLSKVETAELSSREAKTNVSKREAIKELTSKTWNWSEQATTEDVPGVAKKTLVFKDDNTAKWEDGTGIFPWSLESNGDLLLQPQSEKFKARLQRMPNGSWVGKGYGTMAESMGIVHLTPN